MKQYLKSITILIFTIALLSSAMVQAQVTLKVGNPAPGFKAAKWFKGIPITEFEKGKFYVVEFWATWCGPCKVSIPHLTELAHKYKGKVTFIGMDGSEHVTTEAEKIKLIEKFVADMGDKMDYNIALDTDDKYMSLNWMNAAAQFGIPCAFVVDKDSKIAWIGHPMEMEKPLAQILDGTFDTKTYAATFGIEQEKAARERVEAKKFNDLAKPVTDAFKAKEFAKVVSECEALVAKDPSLQSKLDPYYFRGLLQTNPDKALSIAQAEKAKKSDRVAIIAQVFTQKGLDKKFYNFIIEALEPAAEKDANYYTSLNCLSGAYELTGNNAKAIEMMEKMIVYAKANGAGEDYTKQMNDKIAKLKQAK